ncbi:hypothetical protein Tco_0164130 [Tanacetum coccineum]
MTKKNEEKTHVPPIQEEGVFLFTRSMPFWPQDMQGRTKPETSVDFCFKEADRVTLEAAAEASVPWEIRSWYLAANPHNPQERRDLDDVLVRQQMRQLVHAPHRKGGEILLLLEANGDYNTMELQPMKGSGSLVLIMIAPDDVENTITRSLELFPNSNNDVEN